MKIITSIVILGSTLIVSLHSYAAFQQSASPSPVRIDPPPVVHVQTGSGAMFRQLNSLSDMPLRGVSDAEISDDAIVIGVVVEGQPRAYVAKYLEFPDHVCHDQIGETLFSVTYCEATECSRVFEREPDQEIICAGWTGHEMMLRVDGEYWGHSSKGMPVKDLRFSKTTWSNWQQQHPTSLVYTGDGGRRRELFGEGPIPGLEEMRAAAKLSSVSDS